MTSPLSNFCKIVAETLMSEVRDLREVRDSSVFVLYFVCIVILLLYRCYCWSVADCRLIFNAEWSFNIQWRNISYNVWLLFIELSDLFHFFLCLFQTTPPPVNRVVAVSSTTEPGPGPEYIPWWVILLIIICFILLILLIIALILLLYRRRSVLCLLLKVWLWWAHIGLISWYMYL